MKVVTSFVVAAAFTVPVIKAHDVYQQEPPSGCPSACIEVYDPVCGSDGVTYSNSCFLDIADCNSPSPITQVSKGECPKEPECHDICPTIYAPVCGSDGQTYSNLCMLQSASCKSDGSLTKVSDGECPEASSSSGFPVGCPDLCTDIYDPICGSDGVTYGNGCQLAALACYQPNITQVSEGPCPSSNDNSDTSSGSGCPEVCIEIFQPVCGSDGITYSNTCFLDIAMCKDHSITMAGEGSCPDTSVESSEMSSTSGSSCPESCTKIYLPVCGSDGITYSNKCLLEIAECKSGGTITQVYDGQCSTESSVAGSGDSHCNHVCYLLYQPVCGSNGVTYGNSCFLGIATCEDSSITKASEGACEGSMSSSNSSEDASGSSSCQTMCLAVYKPVCGSNDVTYGNLCELERASCENPTLNIKKASDGTCAPSCET